MPEPLLLTLELDEDADAAYLKVGTGEVVQTVEYNESIMIDLDAYGMVVGIEILGGGSVEIPVDDLVSKYHIRSAVADLLQRMDSEVASRSVASANRNPGMQPTRGLLVESQRPEVLRSRRCDA